MRYITIEDEKTVKLLNEKNDIALANSMLLERMGQMEAEYKANIGKMARLDEKARTKLKKIIPELGEYEQVSKISVERGAWEFHIADRMEEFKAGFKK